MRDSCDQTAVGGPDRITSVSTSRREFLQMAAVALGAVTGLGGGLGALLAGCDKGQETSNTTATIVGGDTTATSVAATTPTTAIADVETGRDIKIGVVSASSGPLALCGKADEWWTDFASTSLPQGLVCGDDKLHRIRFIKRDSRSDPARAAREAADLITGSRVDLVMCSGGADMVNPVADEAERLVCPCLSSFVEWRRFVLGRGGAPGQPFKWTYAYAIGLEDIRANFVAMWNRVATNKKIGLLLPDDAWGQTWADPEDGLSAAATDAGYEVVSPGLYPIPTTDFTPYVSEFLRNGCEICCCAPSALDLVAFWRQMLAQGYRPKVFTVGGTLVVPHALEAIGSDARNVTAESLWQPDWPFRDSITGKTCRQLAEDYMAQTGDQWIASIAHYATFEWAVDVFARVANINSRTEIAERIRSTYLDTCLGRIDFASPVAAGRRIEGTRPAENVCMAPVGGAQWGEGETFRFEPRLVTAVANDELPVTYAVHPMEYGS
jgi:branched-chain amino acid transport system substrate-binding protein